MYCNVTLFVYLFIVVLPYEDKCTVIDNGEYFLQSGFELSCEIPYKPMAVMSHPVEQFRCFHCS